jgi:hypothetical protein
MNEGKGTSHSSERDEDYTASMQDQSPRRHEQDEAEPVEETTASRW